VRVCRGEEGTRIFLCVWHVKGAWEKKLRKAVPEWADKQALRQECGDILEMTDVREAREALTAMLERWVRRTPASCGAAAAATAGPLLQLLSVPLLPSCHHRSAAPTTAMRSLPPAPLPLMCCCSCRCRGRCAAPKAPSLPTPQFVFS